MFQVKSELSFSLLVGKMMMEYNQELIEKELCKLRVFSDLELNSEDAHLGSTLENELEYVGRRLTTNSSVPANIHRDKFFKFWEEELEASQFILDTQEWLCLTLCL